MNQRDLLLRIDSQFNDRGFKSAEASAKAMVRELDRQEKAVRDLAHLQQAAQRENESRQAAQMMGMEKVGRAATAMSAVITVGLGLAAKSASDWESAWAGVTKTTSGSAKEMDELEQSLRTLAKTLPVTHEEIAAVAEEAGALGVARQDLAAFTKTAIDLGETTNLSANEAATGLAKLGNIMGVLPTEANRAGSALVALGNNGASTEDEILNMALRIAGAGKTIGLTEAQVLGFASALSSVGIEAESGGSSISRVMIDISKAVDMGGDSLDTFAQVAGMSADAFSEKFRTDAAGAVTAFIGGLGRMQASGQSTFQVLDDLGLSEIRVRDTLLRTSGASDLLAKSIGMGSQAWMENLALVQEANKRYETAESRIKTARNQLNDAAIDIGGSVLPAIAGAAERVGALAEAFQSLPGPVKESVGYLGGAVAALSGIGGVALMAIPKLREMNTTLASIGPTGARAAKGLSSVGSALAGPWGIALAAATIGIGLWAEGQFKAKQRADDLRASLDQQTGAITDQTKVLVALRLEEEGVFERYGHLAGGIEKVTEAALGNADVLRTLRGEQEANEAVLTRLAAKHGDLTDAEYEQLTAAQQQSDAYRGMFEALGQVGRELDPQIDKQKRLAEATGGTNEETEGLNDGLVVTAQDAERARDEIDKLTESVKEYGETLAEARDSNRAYEGSIDDAAESLKKYRDELVANRLESKGFGDGEGKKEVTKEATRAAEAWADAQIKAGHALDIGTEAGRRNQEALDGIAQAAKDAAVANFENGMSVGAVTDKVLAARTEFVNMATNMGMSKAEANKLADQLGLTRQNVERLSGAVESVPVAHSTKFSVETEAALKRISAFKAAVASIPRSSGTRVVLEGYSTGGGLTFGDGGYTGDAPRDKIVGGVHGREFVSDADTTSQHRGLLEHMQAGGDPRAYLGMGQMPTPQVTVAAGPSSITETTHQPIVIERFYGSIADAEQERDQRIKLNRTGGRRFT